MAAWKFPRIPFIIFRTPSPDQSFIFQSLTFPPDLSSACGALGNKKLRNFRSFHSTGVDFELESRNSIFFSGVSRDSSTSFCSQHFSSDSTRELKIIIWAASEREITHFNEMKIYSTLRNNSFERVSNFFFALSRIDSSEGFRRLLAVQSRSEWEKRDIKREVEQQHAKECT